MSGGKGRRCRRCGETTGAGNCPDVVDDGHPVQCVGEWAVGDKHHYLQRYIEASRGARAKFVGQAGAAFIDLFAGPGRARNRDDGTVHATSSVIALEHQASPFTKVVSCDLAPENVAALRDRTRQHGSRVHVEQGDCNEVIEALLAQVPSEGLNFAFVDPFRIGALRFDTLRALAAFRRMDMLINFPTLDVRRNFAQYASPGCTFVDDAVGTSRWRTGTTTTSHVARIHEVLVQELEALGYTGTVNRTLPIKRRGAEMYRLVFVAKNELADKIWASIIKNPPSGQRELPLA